MEIKKEDADFIAEYIKTLFKRYEEDYALAKSKIEEIENVVGGVTKIIGSLDKDQHQQLKVYENAKAFARERLEASFLREQESCKKCLQILGKQENKNYIHHFSAY